MGKVILSVEDERPLQKAIISKLQNEGFEVLSAKDGEEGLRIAQEEKPDLILLDVLMPNISGLEMMKQLREGSSWGKKVPIIVLSNLNADNDEMNTKIAELEPAYYLVKTDAPLEEVVEKIKARLNI